MKRILITGMSGTGKSSVIGELQRLGYRAVDTDYDGFSEAVPVPAGTLTGLGSGRDWVWRAELVERLLSTEDSDALFLGGCSPNQASFYRWFDHIVLLTAAPELIAHRLTTRTTNPFGKHPDELARALALQREIEPLLRAAADTVIDTSAPLDEVVARILRLAR